MESQISRRAINQTLAPIPNMTIAVGPIAVDLGRAHEFSQPEAADRWKPRLSYDRLPYVMDDQVMQSAVGIGNSCVEGCRG